MTRPDIEQLVTRVEARRQAVSAALPRKHRAAMGQFFTPPPVAAFLADLLHPPTSGDWHVLDAGAGVGSLSAATTARMLTDAPNINMHITAFEVDGALVPHLTETLNECSAAARAAGSALTWDICADDFVSHASAPGAARHGLADAVIMNPPYRKVSARSQERMAGEAVGLRASNLYTLFTALSLDLIKDGGEVSAIIPRSFANGPYHEPFRRFVLSRASVDFVHVFDSRGALFADTEVLQENVIVHLTRGAQLDRVTLSSSSGIHDKRRARQVPSREVVRPDDPHAFIRLPIDDTDTAVAEAVLALPCTLPDLGLSVSTGRVVDFRSREHLRQDPEMLTAPLIYSGHMVDGRLKWPDPDSKKPNALAICTETAGLLLPNEHYVVVRRFSAKEEPRRVVAAVSSPDDVPGEVVAFENHLNVFHAANEGFDPALAIGLAAFLNSTLVDQYVRTFSGHTQINATDLRGLRYPDAAALTSIGREVAGGPWPDQTAIDALVSAATASAHRTLMSAQ